MKCIVFACVHNAGRSQVAAAFFNALANPSKATAISAGTQPSERVHPEALTVMSEVEIDLAQAKPQKLDDRLATGVAMLITMGCGDECPVVPGAHREDWPLPDPKGQPLARVREIRDMIRKRVEMLIFSEGWSM